LILLNPTDLLIGHLTNCSSQIPKQKLANMKISALAVLALVGVANAGRPQLSVQVRDGNFADLDGLDPSISWSASTKSGDIDVEYGIEASARPTDDIASLPKSIWGKAGKTFGAWRTSVRGEVEGTSFDSANIEVNANCDDEDLSVKLTGTAGKEFTVSKVEAVKRMESGDGVLTVNPRYNLETDEKDIVIGYDTDKTNVEITASADAQSLTISQQLDDDNRVAPTIASSGSISLEWERSLGDENSVTTTLKPNESIDVEWKDASWTANINMPVDGTSIGGANVSIKREVNF